MRISSYTILFTGSLNKLLSAANHFKPLYGLYLQKATFHKSKDKYNLERGTVLAHDSVIRRLSPIFPGVDLELPTKTLDFYKKAAASSSFEIFYIDEYSIEDDDIVLILGTPTRLSLVTRAQLLILQAQAVEQYVNRFHPQAHCVEIFASLVGSFPDEVLRILLPNSYERLFHAVEYLKRPTVPADYDRGGNERIENNPSSPRP